ncbi:DegT/DnrJ/EryC1/StrS family aminotransferase [Spongorhabdus nitratireducens]
MQPFLPFATPDIGDSEISEVIDSLKNGWLTTGPKVKQLEKNFSEYLGDGVTALAVNSATSGLHLALEALGISEGDEVILPSYTFTATAEVIKYLGATPVFVDIDAFTYNISPESVLNAISPKTKAIMPVHFAGLACDMSPLFDIAKKFNLSIIEDAAHAFPASYKGKKIGTLESDATVFSFYANKTMTTAEGGMIVSSNPELIKRAKTMRLHGINRDVFDRYNSHLPSWYYEVEAPGYKYNMPDINAAIGIHQLKRIDNFLEKRNKLAQFYFDNLKNLPLTLPPTPNQNEDIHAWHLFPILLDEGIDRDKIIESLYQHNIGCSVHFIPLHLHPAWKGYCISYPKDHFKNTINTFSREISIPLYTKMDTGDAQRVVSALGDILRPYV